MGEGLSGDMLVGAGLQFMVPLCLHVRELIELQAISLIIVGGIGSDLSHRGLSLPPPDVITSFFIRTPEMTSLSTQSDACNKPHVSMLIPEAATKGKNACVSRFPVFS